MLEEKNEIAKENKLFNIRKNKKLDDKNNKTRKRLFILSIFLSLAIVIAIYFLSSVSNIYKITVNNNHYMSDDEIIELSELSTDNKFLLTIPSIIEDRIKANELIQDCEVKLLDDKSISITVSEKKLIGYALENNENVLILEDDSRIVVNKDNLYLISYVPLIEGFLKDDIVLIEKNLNSVDYKTINEISEIHNYVELKYQNVELIMRDGNYIFTSVYGLDILNDYYSIASSYSTGKHICYYNEDISGNPYTSACPWEKVVEEKPTEIKELD